MTTALIVLTGISAFLIGAIVGVLGMLAYIGARKGISPHQTLPPDFVHKLDSDLAELPPDWGTRDQYIVGTAKDGRQLAGIAEEGIYSLDTEEKP